MAIDCLEYQPAIDKAVQFACGNTLICDSMEIARTVVYEKGQDVKGEYSNSSFDDRSLIFDSSRHSRRYGDSQGRKYYWWSYFWWSS